MCLVQKEPKKKKKKGKKRKKRKIKKIKIERIRFLHAPDTDAEESMFHQFHLGFRKTFSNS